MRRLYYIYSDDGRTHRGLFYNLQLKPCNPQFTKDAVMFAKKRKPWFVHALVNLAAAALIYRLARGFQKIALKL
jgi:hypothetical protein